MTDLEPKPLPALDSPLRHIPSRLNARQRLFLDGIRLSIEMTWGAYSRLTIGLTTLAQIAREAGNVPIGAHAAMMLDAWSIVDGLHRLRTLLDQSPGMKKSTPTYQLFKRETASVEDLRNHVQHLDQEFSKAGDAPPPAWGELAWVGLVDHGPPLRLAGCAIVPGAHFDRITPMVNPCGKPFHGVIDHIQLAAFGMVADLSQLCRALETFAGKLDKGLSESFATSDLTPGGSDMLIALDIVCGNPDQTT